MYQSLEARLNANSHIVHSPQFGSGTNMVRDRREMSLTSAEKTALQTLLPHRDSNVQVYAEGETIMDQAIKLLKASASEGQWMYLKKWFLVSNLNLCKRLFSVSGHPATN